MIIGIDPGLSGAIVHLDPEAGHIDIFDMPVLEVRKKREVSPQLVADILSQFPESTIYLERVSARPGQGVSSMFNFGMSYGIIRGVAGGLKMKIELVTPQSWMGKMKVPSGKDASRQRAMDVFPSFSQSFARKKDDGRSDAALICMYGFLYGESVRNVR